MRQTVAALMIVAVLMAIVEPFASAATPATIPACCRRDGQHHCMAMAGAKVQLQEDSSPTAGSVPEKCPMRASVRSTATPTSNFPPRALAPVPATSSGVIAYDSVTFVSSGFSSHSDRGPPRKA